MQTKMEAQPYFWRAFALKDTKDLVDRGVLQGTVTRLRERLSKASSLFEIKRLVLWSKSEETTLHAHLLLVFQAEYANPQHVRLYIHKSATFDWTELGEALIDELKNYFVEAGFWRVSVYWAESDAEAQVNEKLFLQRLGMLFEARLEGFFMNVKAPQAAELWAWHSVYSNFQAFFLPYADGALVVSGTKEAVQAVYFLSEGETIEDSRTFLSAFAIGNADKEGHLIQSQCTKKSVLSKNMQIAYDELLAYLSGHNPLFTFVTGLMSGSDFQRKVWAELSKIPYGATNSYLDIARKLSEGDDKKAHRLARAVGSACGANPLCIVTPCHRVIGSDNSLTGFNGGVHFKARLLDMELLGQANGDKNDT